MRVFITGGTGLIGAAVVKELIKNGHSVVGLARSESAAKAIQEAGGEALQGSLRSLDVLRRGATEADGVISLAFANGFTNATELADAVKEESIALKTLSEELVGCNKALVVVSGTPHVTGRASVESDPFSVKGPVGGRAQSVISALSLAERGLRVSAVRLPRTVHNNGNGGFAGILTRIARESGVSGYAGDGEQRWPSVHALDAAVLFRLALEKADPGTVWHAVGTEGDRVRDIATVIGRRLNLPVQSVPPKTYGPLGPVFATDQPSSSTYTQRILGWHLKHTPLLEDLENLHP